MIFKPFGKKSYEIIKRPLQEDSRITILHGSVRSSKNITLLPKILQLCDVTNPNVPEGLGLLTGVTKETIRTNVLNDLFSVVGKGNYRYNSQSGELEIYGTPWKVIGAKDEGSEKYIRGATVAKSVCDELSLMPETFFRQLINRMSVKGARLYGTTNPDTPHHYLYTDFITDQEKKASGMVREVHFNLDDNPSLTEEYKNFIRAAHKGVFYQRYVLGLWVMAEGAIYRDCWGKHLLFNDASAPSGLYGQGGHLDRWIACDYGTDHNHVYGDFLDDGKTVWLVREWVWNSRREAQQKTDSQYADALERFMGLDTVGAKRDDSPMITPAEAGLPPMLGNEVILPPEAASFEAELLTRGLRVTQADNGVQDGLRTVSSLMSLNLFKVHERCTQSIQGIETHVWDPKASERGVEQPLKQHDDEADMIRYGIKTKVNPWRLMV